jgi:hypothetical protein
LGVQGAIFQKSPLTAGGKEEIPDKKQKIVDFSRDIMYITNNMKKRKKLLLMAVFWDLPKFRDEDYLRGFLEEQKGKVPYQWAMARFLERGRVIDTFALFNIKEISEYLPKLQLSTHALTKWKRMIEVYG